MRCRAHGGMKIGTSGRPDNCNRVGSDTVSGETRLFSRENHYGKFFRSTLIFRFVVHSRCKKE
jgi:hypothetical protein